jgi:hypothetical protein
MKNNPADAILKNMIVRVNEGINCNETRNVLTSTGSELLRSRKSKLVVIKKIIAMLTRTRFKNCNTPP